MHKNLVKKLQCFLGIIEMPISVACVSGILNNFLYVFIPYCWYKISADKFCGSPKACVYLLLSHCQSSDKGFMSNNCQLTEFQMVTCFLGRKNILVDLFWRQQIIKSFFCWAVISSRPVHSVQTVVLTLLMEFDCFWWSEIKN